MAVYQYMWITWASSRALLKFVEILPSGRFRQFEVSVWRLTRSMLSESVEIFSGLVFRETVGFFLGMKDDGRCG